MTEVPKNEAVIHSWHLHGFMGGGGGVGTGKGGWRGEGRGGGMGSVKLFLYYHDMNKSKITTKKT